MCATKDDDYYGDYMEEWLQVLLLKRLGIFKYERKTVLLLV